VEPREGQLSAHEEPMGKSWEKQVKLAIELGKPMGKW